MTWSGFRPSDDCCSFGYLTASNMFAAVVLGYMAEMLNDVCKIKVFLMNVLYLNRRLTEV